MMSSGSSRRSYFHEQPIRPYVQWTLHDLLDEHAKMQPTKAAFVFLDGSKRNAISYGELGSRSDRIAQVLIAMGFQKGDYVGLFGRCSIDWIVCEYGVMKAGLITVRLPYKCREPKTLSAVLARHKCRALFYIQDPGSNPDDAELLEQITIASFTYNHNNNIILNGGCPIITYTQLTESTNNGYSVNNLQLKQRKLSVNPNDPASIYLTSGSTGMPKGVPISHFALVNTVLQIYPPSQDPYSKDDIFLCHRPITWSGSYSFFSLVSGGTFVYVDPDMSDISYIDYVLDIIEEEGVTCGKFSPYIFLDLVHAFENGRSISDRWRMKWALGGGEWLNPEVYHKAMKYIPNLMNEYGSTENFVIIKAKHDDTLTNKMTYTGHVSPGVELMVVNDDGCSVPYGDIGELWVRSPYNFTGYTGVQDPKAVGMKTDKNRWVQTGDYVTLSEEGYVCVIGRKAQRLFSNGHHIHPLLIEKLIVQHRQVEMVKCVQIESVQNVICACVIPVRGSDLTPETLSKFVESVNLNDGENITRPQFYIFMDAFPTINAGKVDYFALRDIVSSRLTSI